MAARPEAEGWRLAVALRTAAAVGGGYGLAAAAVLLLKCLPGDPQAQEQAAALLFFPLMAGAAVWAFAAATLRGALGWILGPALLLGALAAVLGSGP